MDLTHPPLFYAAIEFRTGSIQSPDQAALIPAFDGLSIVKQKVMIVKAENENRRNQKTRKPLAAEETGWKLSSPKKRTANSVVLPSIQFKPY